MWRRPAPRRPRFRSTGTVAGPRAIGDPCAPELTDGAQLYEQEDVALEDYDGYYSVAKTYEISLSQRSGKNYESIAYLVEEAT